jgi:HTH-type transcriptional regulator/antitoxin HipB
MKEVNKPLKAVSLDEMIDKHIGEIGTDRRDAFENELRIDLLRECSSEE